MGMGKDGVVQLFTGGSQQQYGVETTLVAGLCKLVSPTFVVLISIINTDQ
jgi:hypothetical protein